MTGRLLSLLTLQLLLQPSAAQLPAALLDFQRHEVKDAESRGAVCNDGSPAVFYFRDCPRPGAECAANPAGAQWLIVFQGATTTSGACFDEESCAGLPAARTSSRGRPAVLTAAELATGIFSDSGEGNPNFYERRAVFVPSCDGSMWLGNGSISTDSSASLHFRGRAIMEAVWEDLQTTIFSPRSIPTPYGPGPNNTKFSDAKQVAVVGSAGIIRWLDTLAASAPVPQAIVGICDGCLLLDLPACVDRPCSPGVVPFCPPTTFLSIASLVWQAVLPKGGISSLFAPNLLTSVKSKLLVQHPQYDREQLKALGVASWPPLRGSKDDVYARMFAKNVRSLMRSRPRNGLYTFALGCSGYASSDDINETGSRVVANGMLDHDAFNCRPVENCTLAGENETLAQLALTAMTSMFLTAKGADPFQPTCIDTCTTPDCSNWCGSHLDCGIRL